jgi:hypothetical protein
MSLFFKINTRDVKLFTIAIKLSTVPRELRSTIRQLFLSNGKGRPSVVKFLLTLVEC